MGRPAVSASPGARGRRAWRVLFLVLLAPLLPRRGASARPRGETCRRWREGHPVPAETFLCPGEADAADARLCCGTCARAYCCAAREAWLDQRPCFRPGRQGAPTPDAADGAPHTTSYLVLALVVSLTLSLFLGCFVWVDCKSLQCCVGACKRQQDPPPVVAAALHPISSSADPSRQAPHDLPTPYSSREMLVPLSAEEDCDVAPPCPEDLVVES